MLRRARQMRATALLLIVFTLPAVARAECVAPGAFVLKEPSIEMVFSGTVVSLNHVPNTLVVHVTFDVDRVWKGSVPKRFELFVNRRFVETPQFELKRRYVALATTMTDQTRADAGFAVAKELRFESMRCGELPSPFAEDSGLVRQLGAGRPPS